MLLHVTAPRHPSLVRLVAFALLLSLAAPAQADEALVVTPAALGDLAVPCFCVTKAGWRGDAVNLVVAATREQLEFAFQRAGWVGADPVTVNALIRVARVLVDERQHYPTAPMSDLYLFGHKQDYSFQKNNEGFRARDHFRVWQTPRHDALGRPWWAIAGTRDVGIKWADGLPTHRIGADVDYERDLIRRELEATHMVKRSFHLAAQECGYYGKNGTQDAFYSDGQVAVVEFVPSP